MLLLCDRAGSALVRAALPARRAPVAMTGNSVGKGGIASLPATGQQGGSTTSLTSEEEKEGGGSKEGKKDQ